MAADQTYNSDDTQRASFLTNRTDLREDERGCPLYLHLYTVIAQYIILQHRLINYLIFYDALSCNSTCRNFLFK